MLFFEFVGGVLGVVFGLYLSRFGRANMRIYSVLHDIEARFAVASHRPPPFCFMLHRIVLMVASFSRLLSSG